MATVILQNSVKGKGVFYPAGMIINIPEDRLVQLINDRIAIEYGTKTPISFVEKIVKKTTRRTRLATS